ncbi:hypothetical protein J6590_042431 [Homalodisca vitripennis]|nr:hypothetical protein J6590_042431 [Homalodisca vitripennis]
MKATGGSHYIFIWGTEISLCVCQTIKMSAKRNIDDDEYLNDLVHRILEELLSTDRMHGSNESQDEDDFGNNVNTVSSELFGGYDSDMDPEYVPSGNTSE